MFKKDQVLFGKVEQINFKNIILLFDEYKAIVFINELSDYFVQNISHLFKIGEKIFVQIYKIEEEEKVLYCSYKALMPNLLKEPFDHVIEETKNGFQNLLNKTNKEIKKWKKSNLIY
ncbi:S1 RNA-binding domain protein [[Mycoplasma] mobile]|uniref:30S ribosomal protein s1 n=1 Tax=Mycoplasma mobile (strain ATCC 43663 / 163K / NCTC 11711) TaxID=267748 RepID=Q6KH89_MYCM1|nr:S1 RNA-binding domain protein [[Mycoplasma] mobile]AAT28041.1 30S ribosomal protein s1 [Mycoplasma mobile 163K]